MGVLVAHPSCTFCLPKGKCFAITRLKLFVNDFHYLNYYLLNVNENLKRKKYFVILPLCKFYCLQVDLHSVLTFNRTACYRVCRNLLIYGSVGETDNPVVNDSPLQ